jgi:hypothetical protein
VQEGTHKLNSFRTKACLLGGEAPKLNILIPPRGAMVTASFGGNSGFSSAIARTPWTGFKYHFLSN